MHLFDHDSPMSQKSSIMIGLNLDSQGCTMIEPGYTYQRDEKEFRSKKVERKEGNKQLLEKTISTVMKEKYEKQIAETLDTLPIVYVNCAEKGEKDIILRIMEVLYKKYPSAEIDAVVKKELLQQSMLEDQGKDHLRAFAENYSWENFGEDFLQEYWKCFKERCEEITQIEPGSPLMLMNLQGNIQQALTMTLNFEMDAYLAIIEKILKLNSKSAYLYLDNTSSLSSEEQQRINLLLCRRGAIGFFGDCYLRIKINNGAESRKTRMATNGHRATATHDYSSSTIREEDL